MTTTNPFTERGRITEPARFAGRWSELGIIFERIEAGRPVLVAGGPGIGKSSLLTHIVQAAAVNLEQPDLQAFYLDMQAAEGPSQIYATLARALGQTGDTLAALELGLVAANAPVLACLDNAQAALAAGWGAGLLEALARVVRGGHLALVVATASPPPQLSERYALVQLGALAATEVRLLVEAYLDASEVTFSPPELRAITELSGAHPAYVQRAAYHLFASKLDPADDWLAAYRAEARDRPIPGAPLPPAVFEGAAAGLRQSSYGGAEGARAPEAPQLHPPLELPPVPMLLGALLGLALVYVLSGSGPLALAGALLGAIGAALWLRSRR